MPGQVKARGFFESDDCQFVTTHKETHFPERVRFSPLELSTSILVFSYQFYRNQIKIRIKYY